MNSKFFFLLIAIISLGSGCSNDPDDPLGYVTGKNQFFISVNGDSREYYVHVPTGYTENIETPVVFMLHGTSGDGEKFYNISGWKELGETENIITVFPSSWRYCIFDEDSQQKTTTKWNTLPAGWTLCNGEVARDDVRFLRMVIDELDTKFNLNHKKIYLAGFSNGGQMAAKCAVEMSDVFAAIVESAGSFSFDTMYFPLRKMPITYQVGNDDYGPGNTGPAIPLSSLDTLLRTPNLPIQNGKHYRTAQTHINSFGLNPNFTITGDTNMVAIATYTSLTPNPINIFQVALIKGLAHAYPNGNNHPLEGAKVNWAWMKQFSLP